MLSTETPLVSIVIPVYNVKDYLQTCIDSVLSQTYKNIEIIIVDDGSTDGSSLLCNQIKETDSRVIVIHQENGGLSAARNSGIKIAKGDYITFIDSDDRVSLQYVELLLDACLSSGSEIAICDHLQGDKTEGGFEEYNLPQDILTLPSTTCLSNWHSKYKDIETTAWAKIYKTFLFTDNQIFYPVGKCFEDVATTHKLVKASNNVSFIKAKLYYYYQRKGSIKNSVSDKRLFEMFEMFDVRISFFRNEGYEKSVLRLERKYLLNCIYWYVKSHSSETKEGISERYKMKYAGMNMKKYSLIDRFMFFVFSKLI